MVSRRQQINKSAAGLWKKLMDDPRIPQLTTLFNRASAGAMELFRLLRDLNAEYGTEALVQRLEGTPFSYQFIRTAVNCVNSGADAETIFVMLTDSSSIAKKLLETAPVVQKQAFVKGVNVVADNGDTKVCRYADFKADPAAFRRAYDSVEHRFRSLEEQRVLAAESKRKEKSRAAQPEAPAECEVTLKDGFDFKQGGKLSWEAMAAVIYKWWRYIRKPLNTLRVKNGLSPLDA